MNANNNNRVPPRFVPTLTEVVEVPAWVLPGEPLHAPAPWVEVEPASDEVAQSLAEPTADPLSPSPALDVWAEEITRRVTEQVEQRLAALLAEHSADMARVLTQAVAQQLRAELPALVHQAAEASAAPATSWTGDGQ